MNLTWYRYIGAIFSLFVTLVVTFLTSGQSLAANLASCSNTQTDSTKWYVQGYQCYTAVGAYAKMTVSDPLLSARDIHDGGHSLAEIAVVDTSLYPTQDSLEVGWNVDYLLYGDTKPHLFVFPTFGTPDPHCYNSCGFVSTDPNIKPGMDLNGDVNTLQQFGIFYQEYHNPKTGQWEKAWWLRYKASWFGYYPASDWGGNFTRLTKAEFYGEVSSQDSQTCTQMGNGYSGAYSQSSQISDIGYINFDHSQTAANVTPYETNQSFYNMGFRAGNSFHYGGYGACSGSAR